MIRSRTLRAAGVLLVAVLAVACGNGNNPFDLTVGMCFDDPDVDDGRVHEVTTADCEQPHDNEVYWVIELPDGDFPGVEDISVIADEGCLAAFPEAIGEDYLESDYFASYLAPSAGSWADGDRSIVCYAFDQDGPVTGSVRTNAG
ncbi:MAG: septum formation family protein [Nitriliruptoraceae bacterium]